MFNFRKIGGVYISPPPERRIEVQNLIPVEKISHTHNRVCIATATRTHAKHNQNRQPDTFSVTIGIRDSIDTIPVYLPYNDETQKKIRELKQIFFQKLHSNEFPMCGVVFSNLKIYEYQFTDNKGKIIHGYKATADNIVKIIK